MYARACEMRIEHEMDRLRQLSRDPVIGFIHKRKEALDKEGNIVILEETTRADAVAARALEIDTLKWRIARIGWRVYGARAPLPAPKQEGEGSPEDNKIIVEGGLPDDDAEMEEDPGIDEPPEDIEP